MYEKINIIILCRVKQVVLELVNQVLRYIIIY